MPSLDGRYPECADPDGAEYKAILTSPLASVRKSAVAIVRSACRWGQWVRRVPGKSVSAFAVTETIGPIRIGLAFNAPLCWSANRRYMDSTLCIGGPRRTSQWLRFSGYNLSKNVVGEAPV